jgi:hypothetical protein
MTPPVRPAASPDPGACSSLSAALDEPLAGTSAVARAWLCLEQPGPWGRDALVESHLEHSVGVELMRRSEGTGVRVVLIRRPGAHADTRLPRARRVYLATTRPGGTALWQGTVGDPKELLDLDLAAIGAGQPAGFGARRSDPLLLVCTNGRRDVCCALLGRPIAGTLAQRHPDAVWECAHIGGHRFAPTAVVLPGGYSYGRVDVPSAERVLAAAARGDVVVDGCRGRSTWPRPGQAAELAVRALIGEAGADALTVDGTEVRHADGRSWRVAVEERPALPPRPESCGKAPGSPGTYVVTGVSAGRRGILSV